MIALEISIVIILFLIITLLILNCMKYQEGFDAGMGLSFGQFYSPNPQCCPEQGCARGFPYRGGIYENMCEPYSLDPYGNERPESMRLLKDKRDLSNSCLKYIE